MVQKKQYKVKAAKKHKSLYNLENIHSFTDALRIAKAEIAENPEIEISISKGNIKMGSIPSFSVLPFLTCPASCRSTCANDCYAAKMAKLYPNVRKAYARNTALMLSDMQGAFKQIVKWLDENKPSHFRFQVSGDIINKQYFDYMCITAYVFPEIQFLAFTKRFDIVNEYAAEKPIPSNLQIIFSSWTGLDVPNHFDFPETDVIMPNCETPSGAKVCGGNCYECACKGVGCWNLTKGEKLYFHLH